MRHPQPRNRGRGLADLDQSEITQHSEADGFTLNANLRYLPYRSFPLFLGNLDQIRQNKDNYRFRVLTLPYNLIDPIPAYENFDGGQTVQTGTCVWGLSFAALDGSASDFEVQIYDTCSGVPFFSEPINAGFLRPTGGTDLYPILIEPRLIVGNPRPSLRVNIANKASAGQRCQLAILCSEPCKVMGPGYGPIPQLPWDYAQGIT